MSEATEMDLREQLARIDRAQVETQKLAEEARELSAEQHTLGAEQLKFSAEQLKLAAEERKYFEEALKVRRDRWLAPMLATVAILGRIGGMLAGVTSIPRLFGKLP